MSSLILQLFTHKGWLVIMLEIICISSDFVCDSENFSIHAHNEMFWKLVIELWHKSWKVSYVTWDKEKWTWALAEWHIEFHINKSQVKRVSRRNESFQIKVDDRELKEVDHFKYLGSVLTRDGYCSRKIKMIFFWPDLTYCGFDIFYRTALQSLLA